MRWSVLEFQEQGQVLNWLLFTVVPLLLLVGGALLKQIKDKEKAENRLTKIESNQDNNINRLEKIEQEQFIVREELKMVKSISEKQDMMYDMLKDLKDELKGR